MPILKFYTLANTLTSSEKADLARVFTAQYAKLMPAFFVNIIFHDVRLPLIPRFLPLLPLT